jgi:hypothetical protein
MERKWDPKVLISFEFPLVDVFMSACSGEGNS